MSTTLSRRPAATRPPGTVPAPAPPTALTASLAIAAGTAAAGTLFGSGVLLGPAAMNGSARGTALVVLAVALPLLLVSAMLAHLGSARAIVVWLGTAGYLAYNAVLFLFATPFNRFFPAYAVMLTSSLVCAGWAAAHLPARALAERFRHDARIRLVAGYVWLVVTLNALAWLRNVLPALRNPASAGFLDGTGLTTNPIYVQDLAIWLPLAALLAARLWRREPWGFIGTGAILTMWAIESVSIAVDQYVGSRADPASTVVSASLVGPFLALAVLGLVPLTFLLRRAGPSSGSRP
jgi:hypothetical protein